KAAPRHTQTPAPISRRPAIRPASESDRPYTSVPAAATTSISALTRRGPQVSRNSPAGICISAKPRKYRLVSVPRSAADRFSSWVRYGPKPMLTPRNRYETRYPSEKNRKTRRPADMVGGWSGLAAEHQLVRRRCRGVVGVALAVEALQALGLGNLVLDGIAGHQPARALGVEADHLPGAVLPVLEHALHHAGLQHLEIDRLEILFRGQVDH